METWAVDLNVLTYHRNFDVLTRVSFHTANIEAENVGEAKKKLLFWARKKLSRFKPGKRRTVHLFGAPRIKHGVALDGDRMIRNRHSCDTICSIRRRGTNHILVEGYGPEAVTELEKE